jgi:dihydroneopterin aldolase
MGSYLLKLSKIRYFIHIGCTEAEKMYAQPFDIDILIYYTQAPKGCVTDDLADVSCYKALMESLEAALRLTRFNLIEKLAQFIHDHIRPFIVHPHQTVEVTVTKLLPPVAFIQGGVSFTYRTGN